MRRPLAGKVRQKVTTYRDFMASRGYLDSSKLLMQARPLLLPFEFNEEEEREITEAIEKEEELMRLEEENKSLIGYDHHRKESMKMPPYVSNLLPSPSDSPDDKIIKQVLDALFSRVCKWDKQYGWSKFHTKRVRQKNDAERFHLRKMRTTQREMIISEHLEKLKKEINKRRCKMENEAEQMCGLLTPWRKSRARPQKQRAKNTGGGTTTNVKKEVINPADISLGGDTFDYSKKEPEPLVEVKKEIMEDIVVKTEPPSTEQPMEVQNNENAEEEPIDRSALHCICRTLYDETKFYVNCDACNVWFHGSCVGLTQQRAETMSGWICEGCRRGEELYCVCQKPYDDTKFYVGCDSCQGWFHPACVGITQEDAEKAREYICPPCREESSSSSSSDSEASMNVCQFEGSEPQLVRSDYTQIIQLHDMISQNPLSECLKDSMDISEYLKIVEQTMDLPKIQRRIESLEYNYLHEFSADMRMMFDNALKFYQNDAERLKNIEELKNIFEEALKDVKQAILKSHSRSDRMRRTSESQQTLDGSLDIDADQLLSFDPSFKHELYFQ